MLKFLKFLGASVLALVLIILIIPYFVSLDKYRVDITEQASAKLGRKVSIGQDITFRILPRPFVKLSDITISSPEEITKENLAEIRQAEVILSLGALLKGQIEIVQLQLDDPKIHLVQTSSTKNNWTFASLPQEEIKQLETNADTEGAPTPEVKAPEPLPFRIQYVRIVDGEVHFQTPTETHKIEDIDLTVGFNSILGPFDIDLELKILNEDFAISGTISKVADTIPINLEVKAFKDKGMIKGELILNPLSFSGTAEISGNLKNLKALLGDFKLPEGLKEDYKITTTVDYQKDNLTLKPLQFRLDELVAKGEGSYGFKNHSGKLSLNLMPGNVNITVTPKIDKAAKFNGHFAVKSQNMIRFLEALKVKTDEMPDFLSGDLNFQGNVLIKENSASTKNMVFALGDASLSGEIGVTDFEKPQISYVLKTSSASKLAKLFGLPLPGSINAMNIKGETIIATNNKISTNTIIDFATAKLQAVGFVDYGDSKSIKPALDLTFMGASLSDTLGILGIDGPKALGKFDIKAAVKGVIPQNLEINVGASTIAVGRETLKVSGFMTTTLGGSKPRLKINAQLGQINLDRLLLSLKQPVHPQGKIIKVAKSNQQKTVQSGNSPWSRELLRFDFLKSFDGDISLSATQLQKGDLIFDNAAFIAKVANGIMDVNTLSSGLYGGRVDLKGRISSQKGQPVTFTGAVKNAQLKNISPREGQVKIVDGQFNATMDFSTSGQSEFQFVNNLKGVLSFSATNGVITGFDIQKIVNQLSNTKDVGSALKLLTTSFSGGQTRFSALNAVVNFSNGIGTINKFVIDGTGANISVDGQVNLPRYTLDIPMVVSLETQQKFPPVTVRIFGPLDNPKRKIDSKKLINFLTKEVFSNVIKSIQKDGLKPENLIRGFLGDKAASNDNSAPGNQSQRPVPKGSEQEGSSEKLKPEEAVKSILRGIF